MIEVTWKRKNRGKGLQRIVDQIPKAAETGIKKALESTRKLAVSFAPGPVKGAIRIEIIDSDTKDVIQGRVFNDTAQVPWSSYAEFGTGLYVDDQGNEEAIRLKRAKKIPWYIHVSMVPESFARYGYPVVIGANGQKYYEVDGMKPHPYMHPAAFQNRDKNVLLIASAIREMIKKSVQ
jgi:hypothetical protein